jgi:hypothetical protein
VLSPVKHVLAKKGLLSCGISGIYRLLISFVKTQGEPFAT